MKKLSFEEVLGKNYEKIRRLVMGKRGDSMSLTLPIEMRKKVESLVDIYKVIPKHEVILIVLGMALLQIEASSNGFQDLKELKEFGGYH